MHAEYQLTVFDRGACKVAYRGRRELVGPEQVIVFAPGEGHDGECDSQWETRSVYLSVPIVLRLAEQFSTRRPGDLYFPQCVIGNIDLQIRFVRLFDAIANPDTRLPPLIFGPKSGR